MRSLPYIESHAPACVSFRAGTKFASDICVFTCACGFVLWVFEGKAPQKQSSSGTAIFIVCYGGEPITSRLLFLSYAVRCRYLSAASACGVSISPRNTGMTHKYEPLDRHCVEIDLCWQVDPHLHCSTGQARHPFLVQVFTGG